MVCYAIKNITNNSYIRAELLSGIYTTNKLTDAELYDDYELALCACPSDFKVIKVKIEEV